MLSGDVEEDDPYNFEPSTTSSSYVCHSPLSSSPAEQIINIHTFMNINNDQAPLTKHNKDYG